MFPLLAACTIKKITDQVLLMFGIKAQNVVGQPLSTLLPNATPNRSTDDLFGGVVARRGGLGGKAKRTLGRMQHLVSSITGATLEDGDMGRSAAFLTCWSPQAVIAAACSDPAGLQSVCACCSCRRASMPMGLS